MKEELKDLTKKVKEQGLAFVDAISDVNKLLRQQTETAKEEISFTRLELKELLNSFYDSIVDQAVTNDVSHDLIDISFDLDYEVHSALEVKAKGQTKIVMADLVAGKSVALDNSFRELFITRDLALNK